MYGTTPPYHVKDFRIKSHKRLRIGFSTPFDRGDGTCAKDFIFTRVEQLQK